MRIVIETIDHSLQKYPTVGDYWTEDNGDIQIRVSELENPIYNGLVAVHELIECLLCKWKGIKEEDITNFDIEFESKREEGNIDEPGFSPLSPYFREHSIATAVELLMCSHIEESWANYDKTVNEL